MSLTIDDINKIRAGWVDHKEVGQLPDAIMQGLGWPCSNVHLSARTLEHIRLRHPDITDFDLLHIPLAIKFGAIARDRKKPDSIVIHYAPAGETRRYRCVLIGREDCTEIWVWTLHRATDKQFSDTERAAPLRAHRQIDP